MVGFLGGLAGGAGIMIVIRAVDQFSATFAKVNKLMLGMGAISIAAGAAIAGGMFIAGKAAAEVETEYAKVNTLLEKGQDAQQIFETFVQKTNVAMGNQGDQLDVLAGLYQTISAGITDVGDAQEFMTFATKAAVGGSAELSSVILAGTKAIAAFGLEVDDTERVMDLFAGTVKAGQTTMSELANAFPTVAGMAGQAGISIEETLGTFAGLTKVLGSSEETATSLSATIRGFIKPTTDMQKAVNALGYDSATTMVKEMGLNKSLKMLNDYVDGDTEAMAKLFPNVRALKAVFPLLGLSAKDVAESIDIVSNSTGLSQKQFEDMQTTSYHWGQAMSAARNVVVDFGKTVNNVFAPAMKVMSEIIKKVSAFWLELPDPIKSAIVIFGAITSAILLVAGTIMILVALKALIVSMLTAATIAIWGAVTASLAFVAANIVWIAIVAAIIVAIVLLVKYWDYVKAALFALGQWFKTVFIMIGDYFKAAWKIYKGYFMVLVGILKWIGAKWSQAWVGIAIVLANTWNDMIDMAERLVHNFIDTILGPINWVRKMLGKETWTLDLDFSAAKIETEDMQKTLEKLKGVTLEKATAPGIDLMIEGAQELVKIADDIKEGALNIVPTFQKELEVIQEQKKVEEEITKELEKQEEVVEKISKEQQAIERGLKYIPATGDVYDPKAGVLHRKDFESQFAYKQAAQGAGYNITIENVYGLDPDEIAKALQDKLRDTTTI